MLLAALLHQSDKEKHNQGEAEKYATWCTRVYCGLWTIIMFHKKKMSGFLFSCQQTVGANILEMCIVFVGTGQVRRERRVVKERRGGGQRWKERRGKERRRGNRVEKCIYFLTTWFGASKANYFIAQTTNITVTKQISKKIHFDFFSAVSPQNIYCDAQTPRLNSIEWNI